MVFEVKILSFWETKFERKPDYCCSKIMKGRKFSLGFSGDYGEPLFNRVILF